MQAFRDAAALLEGQPLDHERETRARQIVQHLGLDFAVSSVVKPTLRVTRGHAAALLNVAARMARIFQLNSPAAPNVAFMGGIIDPTDYGLEPQVFDTAHVAGRGLDAFHAFASCVGEGIEYLSQLEWGGEEFQRIEFAGPPNGMGAKSHAAFLALLGKTAGDPTGPVDLVLARALATDEETLIPAGECLRSRRRAREYKLKGFGSGCAAGEDRTRATLVALLELVERDAAALWWLGGSRGREIDAEVLAAFRGYLEGLRGTNAVRRDTWLLDITSDLGIPSVAAMSVDASGRDFACGLAARVTLDEAIRIATQELCQMELSNCLVRQKLAEGGEGALNAMDRRHLSRMNGVIAANCSLLFPDGSPQAMQTLPNDRPDRQLEWLVDRLVCHGIEAFVVDLTRPALRIPAVRALSPELQRMPATIVTNRLQQSTHDRVLYHTRGIDLL